MSYRVVKNDIENSKDDVYFNQDKYKYMISWRNKKIALLEEQIKGYEETLNICCALIASLSVSKDGNVKKISKSRISKALDKNYTVSCDDKYYYIKCAED